MRSEQTQNSVRLYAFRRPYGRRFALCFALLLMLQMSGLPHFTASAMTGEVADCTSQYSTGPQDRCLPFCPTCACMHLGRTVTVSVLIPMPSPPQNTLASL